MTEPRTGIRALKKQVLGILSQDSLDHALAQILHISPRQVVNPLIGLLCHQEETIRWRAILSLGRLVSALADSNMESAREVMRRFMWQMNEESGGIGWGVPEAMGEVMANHPGLAKEYASILVSYVDEDQCFLEHDAFRRGALWGVGRLATVHPDLVRDAGPALAKILECPDAPNRGLAAWAIGWLGYSRAVDRLKTLVDDQGLTPLFEDNRMRAVTVGALAREALEKLEAAPS
ncbi:MAG: HEAT repeat domain-containing protein [Desulfatibacillum sp.]|nr:HEAT repeat domain-containing protein [Desulfatibacillum sp.]